MSRKLALTLLTIGVLALAATPAFAGKPGGGGGGGKPGGGGTTTPGGSFQLVLLNSTDGLPHYGQKVTFNVTTSATRPFVSLNCYQGGVWVYAASVGFFADYPWEKTFTLGSTSWATGAADCTAKLYTTVDGSRTTTLATQSIHVYG